MNVTPVPSDAPAAPDPEPAPAVSTFYPEWGNDCFVDRDRPFGEDTVELVLCDVTDPPPTDDRAHPTDYAAHLLLRHDGVRGAFVNLGTYTKWELPSKFDLKDVLTANGKSAAVITWYDGGMQSDVDLEVYVPSSHLSWKQVHHSKHPTDEVEIHGDTLAIGTQQLRWDGTRLQ